MDTNRLPIAALLVLGLLVSTGAALAGRGDDSARSSKNGAVEATIDGVDVQISYGRPKVRGRMVWGGLVPYGKVWRTGADEATTISFSADVTVDGQPLSAGTYALFTVPGQKSWTVIFNRQAEQWGAFGYSAADDVLRIDVTPAPGEHTEELTFSVDGARVVLAWAKLTVGFTVAAAG